MTTQNETHLKDMKEQMKKMNEWNKKHKNHKDQFLPKNIAKMDNTRNYKTFMEIYGVMPFQVDGELAGKHHQELVDGYAKERKKNTDQMMVI